MSFNEKIMLNDGRQMPLLGLGVYKAVGENEVEQAIADAADAGYRLIDTASVYKNEDGVGRGIKALTIPRDELFVTTKIWNTAQRIGDVEDSFNRSLERLGLDYVDLFRSIACAHCYTTPGKLETDNKCEIYRSLTSTYMT
ncbi:MAG: aldo/keto reductase [Blautia coccoides]